MTEAVRLAAVWRNVGFHGKVWSCVMSEKLIHIDNQHWDRTIFRCGIMNSA